MPPNVRILVRGTGGVLGTTAAAAAITGAVARNPLVALNAAGFIGGGALSFAAIFAAVALERIGLTAARAAAVALVRTLAGGASVMAVVFYALLTRPRFVAEAAEPGLHSAAGVVVLLVLAAAVVMLWTDR